MVAGVHGYMGAAPKHVAVDKRLEEELAPIQDHSMEENTV